MKLSRDEKRFLKAVETISATGEVFFYAGVSAHSGLPYDDGLIRIEDQLARKGALRRDATPRGRQLTRRAA